MLFHQGVKESIHVAAVDGRDLLAIFDSRTTVGMVRLFAKRGPPQRDPGRDRARGPSVPGRWRRLRTRCNVSQERSV
jgi:hypothetical protein